MNDLNLKTNRRVLVVDDNQAIHDDFRKILKSQTAADGELEDVEASLFGEETSASKTPIGFEIDSAFQGKEGLERVQRSKDAGQPYALAFVDVRMPPGWDGVETTAKIWEVDPRLQVVICTAYSDYSWDDMIAKIGQSDRLVILKKPFDNVEVLQLANALTAKWQLAQQAQTMVEELERLVSARTLELTKSEERFSSAFEHAPIGIALVAPEGRWLKVNQALCEIVGYSADELSQLTFQNITHPDDLETDLENVRRVLAGEINSYQMEKRYVHKLGHVISIQLNVSLVRDSQGQPLHFISQIQDRTERRQSDAARNAMEIQLRHAQKMESIGQLAAGIAHEINTPTQYIGDNTRFIQTAFRDLNPLLGVNTRLLAAVKRGAVEPELIAEVEAAAKVADVEFLSVEIPKAIEESLQGLGRVSKIVRAMKEFSHPGTEDKTPIDLNRAIESTLTVTASEWKYVAEMVTEFDASLPPVPCLPGEFNQVILNIVVNASHAIADVVKGGVRGVITVSTRRVGDWAEIRIRDTGSGIPEKARERIFDPFFTTKGVGKGTGQGLAIARSVVVDKHGGTISFETEIGTGTTFLIRLPLTGSSKTQKKS